MLPFNMPSSDIFFAAKRKVFAHYFYPFPLSINNQPAATDYYNTGYLDPHGENNTHLAYGGYLRARPLPVPVQTNFSAAVNMQKEVQMAIARGITGFTFDILSLADALDPNGHLQNISRAAQAVDTRFAIVPMLDMSSLTGLTTTGAVSIILTAAALPSAARVPDGRFLVSAFNPTQPLAYWEEVIAECAAKNVNVAFIPVPLGSPLDAGALAPVSIGVGGWGTATPAVAAGPADYMQPVLAQQFRPKSQVFWEASNFDTFRAGWGSAIRDGSQYVQLITWSDFSESGQVQPYTDATLNLNIGTAFYDLTAYYATWFVTGVQPPITQDVLYWCHRRMPSNAAHPNQLDNFFPVNSVATDNIELLAFLTAPAQISIDITHEETAPAGITSFKIPIAPGQPTFSIRRDYLSPIQIYGAAGDPAGTLDMTYWSGSFPS